MRPNFLSACGHRHATLGFIATFALFTDACVNKELLPPSAATPRHVTLQLTTTALTQQLAGPSWVFVVAGFDGGNGLEALSYKFAPLTQGSQSLALAVDLAPCLAYNSSKGKDGCPLYVAAALVADTLTIRDSTQSIFNGAYDSAVPIGPFEVSQGRTPTIPPIDLSMSRFGVVGWAGDEALRLGGKEAPADAVFTTFGTEMTPISGVASGSAVPTLFVLTSGFQFTYNDDPAQFQSPKSILSIFENGAWRRVFGPAFNPSGPPPFTDVTAFATNDVYIASSIGLFRYDGTVISRVVSVVDALYSIASSGSGSNKLIIAGGPQGLVVIGNGTTFTRYATGITTQVNGVCISSATEAFASSTSGALYRFDGTTWTAVTTNPTGSRIDLQCVAPGQAYVMNQSGATMRWNGSTWTALPNTGLGNGRSYHIGAASPTEIYAYGDSAVVDRAFYRFEGATWVSLGRTRFTYTSSRPWAIPGGGGAFIASSFGRIERISSATGVTPIAYQPSMRDVFVNSSTSAFAVGFQAFLARWTGGQWIVDPPPPNVVTLNRMMTGVWSDGPSNGWAVGNLSNVFRFTGASWTAVSDSLRPVAARDNYNAVWGSGTNVWAVGDNTILHCTAVSAISCVNETAFGSGVLLSVWGASASNVFAVGDGGRILRYTGNAWNAMTSPTTRTLARISGTSASDIWAIGDSVLLHFDGTQWSNVPMTGDLVAARSHVPTPGERINFRPTSLALWARAPREVYLSNSFGSIYRYDGTGWIELTSDRYRHQMMSMHGTTGPGGCALGVSEAQYVRNGPTLWRGIGSTGCFNAPMGAPARWP